VPVLRHIGLWIGRLLSCAARNSFLRTIVFVCGYPARRHAVRRNRIWWD
jgi:hypothetical protein